uniref:Uncharacterized protein n=1 Tax=Glossina pallidipes TaxID=7398 RepID=A0A1A9ZGH2_GLOPL
MHLSYRTHIIRFGTPPQRSLLISISFSDNVGPAIRHNSYSKIVFQNDRNKRNFSESNVMRALCLSLNLSIGHNSRPTHYNLTNDCTSLFNYSLVSDTSTAGILWGFIITYRCVANNVAGSEGGEVNNDWECIVNKRRRLKHLKRLQSGKYKFLHFIPMYFH